MPCHNQLQLARYFAKKIGQVIGFKPPSISLSLMPRQTQEQHTHREWLHGRHLSNWNTRLKRKCCFVP